MKVNKYLITKIVIGVGVLGGTGYGIYRLYNKKKEGVVVDISDQTKPKEQETEDEPEVIEVEVDEDPVEEPEPEVEVEEEEDYDDRYDNWGY